MRRDCPEIRFPSRPVGRGDSRIVDSGRVWAYVALPQEARLRAMGPEVSAYVDAVKRRHPGRAILPLRRLNRLSLDYPAEAFLSTLATAGQYGLYDLPRLERMILRLLAGHCFDHLAPLGDGDR